MKKKRMERLSLLDSLRGATLVSMILYHACWDAVYMLGADWPWYYSRGGYIWQQSICWTFILLSGFCIPFSGRLLRRGLTVFGAGALVMLVTNLLLPEDRVIFGVLTLIGSCMLLTIPIRKMAEAGSSMRGERESSGHPGLWLALCFVLFVLFKDVNAGVIGTGMLHRLVPAIPLLNLQLPPALYRNLATAYLGFPPADFFSTDYFSLLPWVFLYMSGYALNRLLDKKGLLDAPVLRKEIRPFSVLGRNSLVIYLLHQPVLYAFVLLCSMMRR